MLDFVVLTAFHHQIDMTIKLKIEKDINHQREFAKKKKIQRPDSRIAILNIYPEVVENPTTRSCSTLVEELTTLYPAEKSRFLLTDLLTEYLKFISRVVSEVSSFLSSNSPIINERNNY